MDSKAGSFAEALDTIIDPAAWAAPTRETYFLVQKELAALSIAWTSIVLKILELLRFHAKQFCTTVTFRQLLCSSSWRELRSFIDKKEICDSTKTTYCRNDALEGSRGSNQSCSVVSREQARFGGDRMPRIGSWLVDWSVMKEGWWESNFEWDETTPDP